MMLEFVVSGTPASQQARNRQRVRDWMQDVESAVRLEWESEPPRGGNVMVTINYFFDGVSLDVDNVPKPILDALKGLIFADDAQVTDWLCRKRNVKLELDIERPSPLLLTTFDRRDQFLHIQVADAPTQEVASW